MPCNTHGVQCPVAPGNGSAVPVWDSQSTVNIWERFPGFTPAPAIETAPNGNPPKMETMKRWHFPTEPFDKGPDFHTWEV